MKYNWNTFPTQNEGETNVSFLFRIHDWKRHHEAELREYIKDTLAGEEFASILEDSVVIPVKEILGEQ